VITEEFERRANQHRLDDADIAGQIRQLHRDHHLSARDIEIALRLPPGMAQAVLNGKPTP